MALKTQEWVLYTDVNTYGDSWINDSSTTTNYGSDESLLIGRYDSADSARMVLGIGTPEKPPGAGDIKQAFLILQAKCTQPDTGFGLYFMPIETSKLDKDFVENQVTWVVARNGVAWAVPGGDATTELAVVETYAFPDSVTWTQISINLTDAWIRTDKTDWSELTPIMLKDDNNGGLGNQIAIKSREYGTDADSPRLRLIYENDPPEAPKTASKRESALSVVADPNDRTKARLRWQAFDDVDYMNSVCGTYIITHSTTQNTALSVTGIAGRGYGVGSTSMVLTSSTGTTLSAGSFERGVKHYFGLYYCDTASYVTGTSGDLGDSTLGDVIGDSFSISGTPTWVTEIPVEWPSSTITTLSASTLDTWDKYSLNITFTNPSTTGISNRKFAVRWEGDEDENGFYEYADAQTDSVIISHRYANGGNFRPQVKIQNGFGLESAWDNVSNSILVSNSQPKAILYPTPHTLDAGGGMRLSGAESYAVDANNSLQSYEFAIKRSSNSLWYDGPSNPWTSTKNWVVSSTNKTHIDFSTPDTPDNYTGWCRVQNNSLHASGTPQYSDSVYATFVTRQTIPDILMLPGTRIGRRTQNKSRSHTTLHYSGTNLNEYIDDGSLGNDITFALRSNNTNYRADISTVMTKMDNNNFVGMAKIRSNISADVLAPTDTIYVDDARGFSIGRPIVICDDYPTHFPSEHDVVSVNTTSNYLVTSVSLLDSYFLSSSGRVGQFVVGGEIKSVNEVERNPNNSDWEIEMFGRYKTW